MTIRNKLKNTKNKIKNIFVTTESINITLPEFAADHIHAGDTTVRKV